MLYSDPFEKSLSPEEKEIYQQFKVFMRFHSKEEHEEFLRIIIDEHRTMKKIQDLKVLCMFHAIFYFHVFQFLDSLIDISISMR